MGVIVPSTPQSQQSVRENILSAASDGFLRRPTRRPSVGDLRLPEAASRPPTVRVEAQTQEPAMPIRVPVPEVDLSPADEPYPRLSGMAFSDGIIGDVVVAEMLVIGDEGSRASLIEVLDADQMDRSGMRAASPAELVALFEEEENPPLDGEFADLSALRGVLWSRKASGVPEADLVPAAYIVRDEAGQATRVIWVRRIPRFFRIVVTPRRSYRRWKHRRQYPWHRH